MPRQRHVSRGTAPAAKHGRPVGVIRFPRRVRDQRVICMGDDVETSRTLDLRGEVCPYTFIKTVLALEEMEPAQVLEVTLDHTPAVENVPRSVRNRGHDVLEVRQVTDSDWVITIRKGTGT